MRETKSPSNHISMFTAIGVFGVLPGSAGDCMGEPLARTRAV
jgi:hypothetical protein